MSNYTVLERNLLNSFDTDQAESAFLWACERDGYRLRDPKLYEAEAFAREVDWLAQTIWPLIQMAGDMFNEAMPHLKFDLNKAHDLFEFVMIRHSHHRYKTKHSYSVYND